MPFFKHDGLNFFYQEEGQGIPFIFQHGLGGDVSQPFGLFTPPPGVRLLAFDFRCHGQTRPVGDPSKIGLTSFADDLRMFLDYLGIDNAVIGGISMGAAVTLNFTLRHPSRVLALVQSRAAWLDGPMQQNARIFGMIAHLIRTEGPRKGLETFKKSEEFLTIQAQSLDSASSLERQFTHPRAEETVLKLERIPGDAPNLNRLDWRLIEVPTLVLANRHDPIHPFSYGEVLASTIPNAEFRELTPKSVNLERHGRDVQRFIEEFLHKHFFLK
jgi:pimeloyl-ACP methyl ester carboxylesterase